MTINTEILFFKIFSKEMQENTLKAHASGNINPSNPRKKSRIKFGKT